jgi:dienelactone hydrolase
MRIKKMNIIKRVTGLLLQLVLLSFILDSCQKEKSATNYTFLKSSENVGVIPVANTVTLLTYISLSYPQGQPIIARCLYDVAIYKVTYNTTFKNSSIVASGLICVPKSAASFPLLTFQNGTNTKNDLAPTMNWQNNLFEMIEGMASTGYIILIPDYIGFGASSSILHPYIHRESSNASVIDLIKAAEEFLSTKPSGATGNGKLYLIGYSQGGWATLSALDELEKHPIATEQLQAASCGAGSYDLISMTNYLRGIQTFPTPLYLPYFAQSHIKNGFLNTSLNTIFKEPYATRIPKLFNDSLDADQIDAQLTNSITDLITDSLILNFESSASFSDLRNELTVNSVPAWNTTTRIFFAAGTGDKDVPSFITENTYNAFKDLGVDTSRIKLTLYPGLTHQTALVPWGLATFNWFSSLK